MSPHRGIPSWLIPVSCLVAAAAVAQDAPEKALKYHEVLLKRPHNAALFERFFGAWLDEQPVEALDAFLKARAESAGGHHWTVLAIYQLRRGNEEDALAALAKGIEAVPDDPALSMARAKLRLRRLEFEGAREDLAKVAAGKDEVLALEAAKLTGKVWLREGRTGEAIKAWDAVLAAHPGDEDLLEDLVETAAAESQTAQALVYAGKLIDVSRDPYQKTLRMLRRGDLLAQAGRSDEAVETYAAILNQVGEGSWLEREVLAQVEKVFRKQDRLDDLSAQLKKLAEAYPQRLLIHRQLAKLEAAQGETDTAIGRFREVLKRSPGDKELREEFVRLLVDGERFDDAVAELEKLIAVTPADAGLYLQVAALRSRQTQPEAVLAALRKAHELLGNDESNGIRIAGLMLQYGLTEPGEFLLKTLTGPAAMEALAAQYGRTGRKAEAVELLKKAAAGDDVEVLLRTSGAISGLGENAVAFEMLAVNAERFSSDPRFLTAFARAALAAEKPAEAVPQALKLVRLAKQANELAESINLASRVIAGAEKSDEVRATLTAQATRTAAETCLLASLLESGGDLVEAGKLLEPDPDPLVIRFHAALLDRRGDFKQAIAVITRLADTAEGRKAAYFKDLSELQQRAGRMIEALATLERWKLAAPGDKTAWITASRLLRETGNPGEAVKMLRQAAGRFEGDADLAANLASLHDEAGQWREAELIYWKLHDDAQDPSDQTRWVALLAQLAKKSGRIAELEDKLRERARGSRRSLGSILALAELARATNNDDQLRELMGEALRLQPRDIDLRLQVATLEEEGGNPERTLALLEEALAFDSGDRIRGALAQAYLRLGQPLKGLREFRLLAGKSGFDPRAAESAATLLAGSKLFDDAISFLRAELPDGGDWRSRYLLALLLEEDGRENEAVPIFLELLRATGDIPGLGASGAGVYRENSSAECREVSRLVSAQQAAYTHRNPRYPTIRNFILPRTPENARHFALIHLATLLKAETGGGAQTRRQIEAAGVGHLDFIIAGLTFTRPGVAPDLLKLLETHPNQPGLMEHLAASGKIDRELALRMVEQEGKLDTVPRFLAWSLAAAGTKPENPAWPPMFAAAEDCLAAKPKPHFEVLNSRLLALLRGEGDCPEEHRPAAKRLLLEALAGTLTEHPENPHDGHVLHVLSTAGTPEAWLTELNAVIRESKLPGARVSQGSIPSAPVANLRPGTVISRRVGTSEFALPTLETLPFSSIPPQVLGQLSAIPGEERQRLAFSVEDLLPRLAQIESPVVRAWLAVKSGNRDAIDAALAVVPPPEEAGDFELVRAFDCFRTSQVAKAFAPLIRARAAAGSNRDLAAAIDRILIAAAGSMTPEERKDHDAEIEATFLQYARHCEPWQIRGLAAQATEFGFPELAKRVASVSPMASQAGVMPGRVAGMPAGVPLSMGRTYRPATRKAEKPDPIRKFVAAKKFEAAAFEVLQRHRNRESDDDDRQAARELANMTAVLGKGGQAELLKLVDPGDSQSLVKRLEYIEVCEAIGKGDLAADALDMVSRKRPNDAALATRLVLTTAPDRMERRLELMDQVCKWEGFVNGVFHAGTRLGQRKDTGATLDFFELVTRWLETADPDAIAAANLTWVPFYGKQFFLGDLTSGLPSLFSDEKGKAGDQALIDRRKALGDRLARAMLRHAGCAEEGFRLLAAAKALKIDHSAKDHCARAALLATTVGPSGRDPGVSFFTMDRGKGITEPSLSLAEFSSAGWLVKRIKEVKNPDEIFTAEFVGALRQRDPAAGDFLATLCRDLTAEDFPVLWNSEVVQSRGSRLARMLRPLMIQRMALTPGSSKFLAEQISEMLPLSAVSRYGNGDSEETAMLFAAALTDAAAAGPAEMDAVARAISRAVFGEFTPDFNAEEAQQAISGRVGFMEGVCRHLARELPALVRMQAAFFQLARPLGSSDSFATGPFGQLRFTTVDEAETFLESLGWLADVDRWEPYIILTYRRESNEHGATTILEPKLILASALQSLRHDGYKADALIQRLKDRKTGRFGSLMVAAALSSGPERSALADQAFTEFSAELAKLPGPRVDGFALLLPWLGDDVRAKLPENFRRKQPPQAEGMAEP